MTSQSNITIVQKDESNKKWTLLLFDGEHEQSCYAIVCVPQGLRHMCGYLNVPKQEWLAHGHKLRDSFNITFEAIENRNLSISNELSDRVPVNVYGYWVGVDYKDHPEQPTMIQVATRMYHLFFALNEYKK